MKSLPDALFLKSGAQTELRFTLPGNAELQTDSAAVISSFDQSASDLGNTVTLTAGDEAGEATLTYRLLGLIPVKTVAVTVETERTLVPGGQSVGVALLTEGVVVGRLLGRGQDAKPRLQGGHTRRRPHRARGRYARHRLRAAALAHLPKAAKPFWRSRAARKRWSSASNRRLIPRTAPIVWGAWVRDSTAGIGTLSFYDPESGAFGALGHAITDVDTGIVLPVGYGGIYESSVVDISKGKSGEPGELLGTVF